MSRRLPALAPAALALGAAAVYIAVISSQDDRGVGDGRVLLVALSLCAAAVAEVLAAVVRSGPARTALASAGAFTLLVWTILGAASIGILVLPSAVLALVVTGRATEKLHRRTAVVAVGGGAALAVAVAAAGLAFTG